MHLGLLREALFQELVDLLILGSQFLGLFLHPGRLKLLHARLVALVHLCTLGSHGISMVVA